MNASSVVDIVNYGLVGLCKKTNKIRLGKEKKKSWIVKDQSLEQKL